MSITRWFASVGLVVGSAALAACSGGGGSPTSPSVYPIMIITNSWAEETQSDHVFNLVSNDDGKMEGSFQGDETLPDSTTFDVAGSWKQGTVTMTTTRLPGTTFRAPFTQDSPTRLEFSISSGGKLVLVRSP